MTPAQLMVLDAAAFHWEGAQCSVSEPSAILVRTVDDWESLWNGSLGAQPPAVDFSRYFALAAFAGLCHTGGYAIEFLPPVLEKDIILLPYRVRPPSASGFVIQCFTQPYGVQLYHVTTHSVAVTQKPS